MTQFTVTPAAARFIARMIRFGGQGAQAGFRLCVSAGGCSGFNSEFSVEAAPRPGDQAFEQAGVRLFLPAESRLLLEGVTIDFSESATHSGLSFFDPKASGCGCSSSAAKHEDSGLTQIQV
ncbi:Iron-sulfur cluster assembly accessory protein [Solimonas aquatica]|uniref:Iron-sulfur cluster assembly accessory protein n=1 Tax=Solimonas aquatica TaxID=489703 RepID=A0A1H9IPC7_9GAMM|nr:iron-sulfur cluster assembly accessory protein [Solimonas aquatica]SEQ76406.1 Iron-sulfur cluster assembly accessory protein [Solimonas aquatica]